MIIDLENTTISKVSKRIVQIREQGGVVALGRVLTLVIETDFKGIEPAIQAANDASREHPCRIIVLADDNSKSKKKKIFKKSTIHHQKKKLTLGIFLREKEKEQN